MDTGRRDLCIEIYAGNRMLVSVGVRARFSKVECRDQRKALQ